MTTQAEEILAQAMKLSWEERGDLTARLMGSVGPAPSEDLLHPEWDAEIARRVEEIRSGQVEGVPAEELHRKMRELLSE